MNDNNHTPEDWECDLELVAHVEITYCHKHGNYTALDIFNTTNLTKEERMKIAKLLIDVSMAIRLNQPQPLDPNQLTWTDHTENRHTFTEGTSTQ